MGYYLGGDREDEGNYTPFITKSKRKPENSNSNPQLEEILNELPDLFLGVDLPTEFDPEYFSGKQSKFGRYSPDYWEWENFSKFSRAVYAFYRQAISQFYAKFPPTTTLSKFEETAIGIKYEDLEELAAGVKLAERNLISQFDKSKRQLGAKIKKYPALINLRESAARAWIMYYALNKKLSVHDSINFKTSYANFDLSTDLDKLKTFRGCAIMKNRLNDVRNKFLIKKFNLPAELYADVEEISLLNDLLTNIGGFKTTDYDSLLSENDVTQLELKYPNLMHIYLNYDYIIMLIKQLNAALNNAEQDADFYFDTGNKLADLYTTGINIYKIVLSLLNEELDAVFAKDLNSIKVSLQTTLNATKPIFEKGV